MIKRNLNILDRIIRLILGLSILGLSIITYGFISGFLLIIGIILFVTGIIGRCPIYKYFGIKTIKCPECNGVSCKCEENINLIKE